MPEIACGYPARWPPERLAAAVAKEIPIDARLHLTYLLDRTGSAAITLPAKTALPYLIVCIKKYPTRTPPVALPPATVPP
jgi:hypothetical protein